MSQSAVWRIESGEPRRKISVDELVAFGHVFGMTVEALLQPVTVSFPSDLIELHVNKWVDSFTQLQRIQIRTHLDLGQVVADAWNFPNADPLIRELITKRANHAKGMDRGLETAYLKEYEKALARAKETEGGLSYIDVIPLVVARREEGKSDDEIEREADSWGLGDSAREALRDKAVHYSDPDFSGGVMLDWLEIRGGRLALKREYRKQLR